MDEEERLTSSTKAKTQELKLLKRAREDKENEDVVKKSGFAKNAKKPGDRTLRLPLLILI